MGFLWVYFYALRLKLTPDLAVHKYASSAHMGYMISATIAGLGQRQRDGCCLGRKLHCMARKRLQTNQVSQPDSIDYHRKHTAPCLPVLANMMRTNKHLSFHNRARFINSHVKHVAEIPANTFQHIDLGFMFTMLIFAQWTNWFVFYSSMPVFFSFFSGKPYQINK